ncbi:hypothetical protein [Chondromyces apiculatus]|uniref:Uncharacterized protein n=1 Tax=Chondromyces apiculatus DSM 436 TaxID=1192034 RepID=A0A017SWH2_9BACT|nr:hypothetical protein [Chondromyces apiculatus]EYF01333.1 Hypothetical protein CAP_8375 [Chondromyces apiculatus DSM 436]
MERTSVAVANSWLRPAILGWVFTALVACDALSGIDGYHRVHGNAPSSEGGSSGEGGSPGPGGTGGSGAGGTDLPAGTPCNTSDQCTSGFCIDNVCCETACDATCQACSAESKADGADGTCGNAKNGVDSHDDCEDEGAETCGPYGLCDGEGACRVYYPAGSSCGAEADCESGTQTFPDQCDGDGMCVIGGTLMCGSYACDSAGTACLTTCTTQADCTDGNYCNAAGQCVAELLQGQPCTGGIDGECATGFCVDDVCCNTACDAECQACSNAKKGSGANGTCGNIGGNNADPDDECGAYTCNAGACRTSCTTNNHCSTGYTCSSMVCEQP